MDISFFQFVPHIPADFIHEKISLLWKDIKWAQNHKMFGSGLVVQLASMKKDANQEVRELALLDRDHWWRVEEIVDKLASSEPEISEVSIQRKWLYIVLSYLYAHKEEYDDPWQKIEEIYADFGHPPELIPIVRYMPKDRTEYDPSQHTREENLQRFFELWKEYIEKLKKEVG